jgi:predicted CXXCH cytochrome family protein
VASGRYGVICLLALVCALALACPGTAMAYKEPNPLQFSGCSYCHPHSTYPSPAEGGVCVDCHGEGEIDAQSGYEPSVWYGPHSQYSSTTKKCQLCHTLHAAPTGWELLRQDTASALCMACHDGTGGFGVYGLIKARTGIEPGSAHRIDATNVIPGGNPVTAGDATRTFEGVSGRLTCIDCHTPHNANAVAPFTGDRSRTRGRVPNPVTTKLLKRRVTGASYETSSYGSDWCLECHAGRSEEMGVFMHPVEQSSALTPNPYTYASLAIVATSAPTTQTVMGSLGGVPYFGPSHYSSEPTNSGNRGYLMPYPRTPLQSGHGPICQQCHEDSRNVGNLSAEGNTATPVAASIGQADDVVWSASTWTVNADNPAFQNFPHESVNASMLVEPDDTLCFNCHPADMSLP